MNTGMIICAIAAALIMSTVYCVLVRMNRQHYEDVAYGSIRHATRAPRIFGKKVPRWLVM